MVSNIGVQLRVNEIARLIVLFLGLIKVNEKEGFAISFPSLIQNLTILALLTKNDCIV